MNIARVGNLEITKIEIINLLQSNYGKKESFHYINLENKKKLLEPLILNKLKLNAAIETGLDKDADLAAELEGKKIQLLSDAYYQQKVVSKFVPERLVQEIFKKTANEIKVSHILISHKDAVHSFSDRSEKEALEILAELTSKIDNGESVAELALKYSDDNQVQQNKGELGFITYGRMPYNFIETAYTLNKNEVSAPVPTVFGYHIIYLHDTRPNENYNADLYEENKSKVKRYLQQEFKKQIDEEWKNVLDQLKKENNFYLNRENIFEFAEATSRLRSQNTLDKKSYTRQELDIPLAIWDRSGMTSEKFLNAYGPSLTKYHANLTDTSFCSTYINMFGIFMLVAEQCEREGLNNEKVADELNAALEAMLLIKADEEFIDNKIEINDNDLIEYYTQNKNEFKTPAEIEIWEIFLTNKAQAEKVYKLAQSGQNFEELARKYSEMKFFANRGGALGFKTQQSRGTVSIEAFKAGENKIIGPVPYGKGWCIVKTGKLKKEDFLSLDQARDRISQIIIKQKKTIIKTNWEEELKTSYAIQINEDILAEI
jgi:parvulin-like peptidyl-prolyl isomerase